MTDARTSFCNGWLKTTCAAARKKRRSSSSTSARMQGCARSSTMFAERDREESRSRRSGARAISPASIATSSARPSKLDYDTAMFVFCDAEGSARTLRHRRYRSAAQPLSGQPDERHLLLAAGVPRLAASAAIVAGCRCLLRASDGAGHRAGPGDRAHSSRRWPRRDSAELRAREDDRANRIAA